MRNSSTFFSSPIPRSFAAFQALAAALAVGVICPPSRAGSDAVIFRTVALSGQPAPGLAPGVTLLDPFPETTFLSFPRIDGSGRVISFIAMGGAASSVLGGNGQSIWAESVSGGALTLIVRQGNPAPGTEPGVVFEGFPSPLQPGTPSMVDGRTTFRASVRGPGIIFGQTNNAFAVYSNGSGALNLLARSGQQAPGLPAGVIFGQGVGNPFTGGIINSSGRVLHGAFLGGPGISSANAESLWSDRGGSLQMVLQGGDPAPGTTAVFGASPESFSPGGLRSFAFNNQSRIALYGNLTGPGIDFLNDDGIWVEGERGLELIAREAAPAPGTPWTFGEGGVSDTFNSLRFNNDGKVAFRAGLGAGSMVSGNATLWSNRSGNLSMIVGPGINQPGVPAGSVTGAAAFSLTNTNHVGFIAGFLLPGQIFSTDSGLWTDRSGAMELVLQTGDQVPGVDEGVVFDRLLVGDGRDFFRQADNGVIGFRARLAGPGVSAFNDLAYLMSRPDGSIRIVLREDQLLDVSGDGRDLRVVNDILPGGMNDSGQWSFKILFDDGTLGIVAAEIDSTPSIIGDLNGDGHVNTLDLGILLSSWSIPPTAPGCLGAVPCPADLDHNGVVNSLDLGILLSHWG